MAALAVQPAPAGRSNTRSQGEGIQTARGQAGGVNGKAPQERGWNCAQGYGRIIHSKKTACSRCDGGEPIVSTMAAVSPVQFKR